MGKRRAGYVPSGSRRKIPLIRILLLVVAAVLVYRKFDDFWPKFRSFVGHPKVVHSVGVSGNAAWIYSGDSTRAVLNCSRFKETDYCPFMEELQPGLCGQVRATLEKARRLDALNAPVLSRVELYLPGTESQDVHKTVVLVRVEGRDSKGKFRYERTGEDPFSSLCDSARGCLKSPSPRLPLEYGRTAGADANVNATGESFSRWTSKTSSVFPVLPGRIFHVDSLGPDNHRAVLYHGNELYTTYEGLDHIAAGLKNGALVDPFKAIGYAAPVDSLELSDSSKYRMSFRVEQAGMFLDPLDFLAVGEHSPNGR